MSNTTKVSASGGVGPEDKSETVVTLMGDDMDNLTPVEELKDNPEESTEGLHPGFQFALESLDDLIKRNSESGVKACEGENENGNSRPTPPMVSRGTTKDGSKSRITIILGPHERSTYLGIVISLIDSASENDVVDITIVGSVSGQAGTMSQRSILAAISRCKGHVITRAGALTTVGDVAMWLSGKEIRFPKMGLILMRQPISGFIGDTADFESKLADFKASMKEFSDYIVERGLFTQEEMDRMYEERAILSLFGDELRGRVAKLKNVA